MIVVVASSHDTRARNIVAHWGSQCAAMLTAEDLSRPGWSFSAPRTSGGVAVIGGERVRCSEISGILTLRPCIFQGELADIHADDRAYVAAEMNAFLLAWLAAQSCPVLNRPSAWCLAGPNWRPEQWTQAAARVGIPVHTRRRHVPGAGSASEDAIAEVIAVGERTFGFDDLIFAGWARRLARAAGVALLCARFSQEDRRFLSAHPWPAFRDDGALAAVRELLEAA